MLYIKVDADGNPEGYPLSYENVQYLIGVEDKGAVLSPEQLAEMSIKEIKNPYQPANGAASDLDSHDVVRLEIVKNADGDIEQLWSVTEISLKEKIRRWVAGPRGSYLIRSDWTQLPDAPLTAEEKAAWAEYRAKLRSITDDIDFNTIHRREDLVLQWPTPPGALDSVETKWANTDADGIQP